jgi:hypothetical protein
MREKCNFEVFALGRESSDILAMPRRPAIRSSDVDAAVAALEARGIRPCAIDLLPTGAIRVHIAPPQADAVDDLDRELAAFEARNGQH